MRKAGKRLRYTAEAARPLRVGKATRLVKQVKAVQELLREHQDSVVARVIRRELDVASTPVAVHGRACSRRSRVGWLALFDGTDRQHVVRAALVQVVGVTELHVQRLGDDHRVGDVEAVEHHRQGGDLAGLLRYRGLGQHCAVCWSSAATRCGRRPWSVVVPRTVLPAIAITGRRCRAGTSDAGRFERHVGRGSTR
jgi:hypothetical protein